MWLPHHHSHRASSLLGDQIRVVTCQVGPSAPHDSDQLSRPTSLAQIIFLQSRPRLPQTAALLSSCIDGYIYAWSIYGYGGLLGKFSVDSGSHGDVVVGAMTTDENDCILVTGDSKGNIKVRKVALRLRGWCQPNSSPLFATGNRLRSLVPTSSGYVFICEIVGSRRGYLRSPFLLWCAQRND